MHHNVLEGLVKIDDTGALIPALARSWTIAPDALQYVFTLRDDVVFHDGRPFTSADVKAKFERALQSDSGHTNAHYYAHIEAIDTPDDHTAVFHMNAPDSEFLYNLARPDSVILSGGGDESMRNEPVGTGPFQLKTWARGSHITLERFDDYYVPELPYVDEVTFRFVTDPSAQVASLLARDADAVAAAATAEQALRVERTAGFKVIEATTTNTVVLALNNGRAPLDDPLVRRALTYAIDREEIMLGAEFGYGVPIVSHMTPAEPYYANIADIHPHDPAQAKALLAEAGYADGLHLTLSLSGQYPYSVRAGELIADQLERIGVRVDIELVEWATWISRIFGEADYDMTVIGHAEPMDIGVYGNPDYYFRYDSPDVQAALAAVRQTGSETERAAIYADIQRQLAEDAVNVWLYARPSFLLSRADVYGWWTSVPMVVTDVTGVYFGD